MKKHIGMALLVVASMLASPLVLASGVPTVDAAKLAQDEKNHALNMAKYLEMIQQYKNQLRQMETTYKSISGTRNLGNLLNDPQFASYLPDDWKKVYNSVQNGGYKGLTGTAKAIRDGARILDACKGKQGEAKQRCEQMADKSAQDYGLASDAFDKATSRWDQIQGLLGQINKTTDPKAIAELQARINGETAALQNEQTKLQMMQMMAAAQDKIMEQADREATVKAMREAKYVPLKPVEYKR